MTIRRLNKSNTLEQKNRKFNILYCHYVRVNTGSQSPGNVLRGNLARPTSRYPIQLKGIVFHPIGQEEEEVRVAIFVGALELRYVSDLFVHSAKRWRSSLTVIRHGWLSNELASLPWYPKTDGVWDRGQVGPHGQRPDFENVGHGALAGAESKSFTK